MIPSEHVKKIGEIVKGRLEELGLQDSIPNLGIIRVVAESTLEFVSSQDEEEGTPGTVQIGHLRIRPIDPQSLSISTRRSNFTLSKGREIVATGEDGDERPIAFLPDNEAAMYLQGHRITVKDDGTIQSHHQDESECEVGCHTCKEAKPYLRWEGLDCYAGCHNCHSETGFYQEQFEAVAAFLVGKVEIADHE